MLLRFALRQLGAGASAASSDLNIPICFPISSRARSLSDALSSHSSVGKNATFESSSRTLSAVIPCTHELQATRTVRRGVSRYNLKFQVSVSFRSRYSRLSFQSSPCAKRLASRSDPRDIPRRSVSVCLSSGFTRLSFELVRARPHHCV